jgi:hypothetical protein
MTMTTSVEGYAYRFKVGDETVHTLHFEAELAPRDLELLRWWGKDHFGTDGILVEPRAPIPGMRPVSFQNWLVASGIVPGSAPNAPAAVSLEPEVTEEGFLRYVDPTVGEDLSNGTTGYEVRGGQGGAKRKFSAQKLRSDMTRAQSTLPERPWLYVRYMEEDVGVLFAKEVDSNEYADPVSRAHILDNARRQFRRPLFTRIEVNEMDDGTALIAVWGDATREPDDNEHPDW